MVLADPTQKHTIHWVQAMDHYFWGKRKNLTHFSIELVHVSTVIVFNGFINNYIKQFIKIHALSV